MPVAAECEFPSREDIDSVGHRIANNEVRNPVPIEIAESGKTDYVFLLERKGSQQRSILAREDPDDPLEAVVPHEDGDISMAVTIEIACAADSDASYILNRADPDLM